MVISELELRKDATGGGGVMTDQLWHYVTQPQAQQVM